MESRWISAPRDRPRCRATDRQGRRCREPVLWDEAANRPLSTRCPRHGGLADATLIGRPAAESPARWGTLLGRPAGLFALVLAGGLWLATAGPALASFETAVAAYERGAYAEAQEEFETLADAGDERADPYLESIRRKVQSDLPAEEGIATTLSAAITGLIDAPDKPSLEPPAVSSAAEPDRSAGGYPAARRDPGARSNETAYASESDVIVPQHDSLWSSVFHLPGDATVIGLQYVARVLSADKLGQELRAIGRHGDEIALSVLAGFWWLVIVRGVIGAAVTVGRVMKAAAMRKENRYG